MSERVLVHFFVLQETPNMRNINSVQELVDQLVGVLGSQLHSTVFPAAVADGLSMGCLVNAHSSVTCDALALPVTPFATSRCLVDHLHGLVSGGSRPDFQKPL